MNMINVSILEPITEGQLRALICFGRRNGIPIVLQGQTREYIESIDPRLKNYFQKIR
ncbi:hypothetical protein [Enterococcus hirae]|uniref:hypothetical protein n=1 Tax=Enterococcus hirae TaxID=1354 RepID=UPI001377C8B0|nr:hypothetical protein [Enterococcus hirae]EHA3992803.1 hypothetical protein [Enterococcus faecalis]NBA54943.1 hypothetical protein [Enterococcus hirae]